MSKTKAGGSTGLGRDSKAKRLGVKKYGAEKIKAGMIIMRQRGTKVHPGENVKRGNDDTLYAGVAGVVSFSTRKKRKYNGKLINTQFANVIPAK